MKRGFTLVELLAALVLTAVLMGAVLVLLGGMQRDARQLEAVDAGDLAPGLAALLRHDWQHASEVVDGALVGHAGIDPATLTPNLRPSRVRYTLAADVLRREQVYRDTPTAPAAWSEVVGTGVEQFAMTPDGDVLRVRLVIDGRAHQLAVRR